jgi:RecB family endonuclease NucS
MDWASFVGAIAGAVIGTLTLWGGILLWDEFQRRRTAKAKEEKRSGLDNILEKHLEEYIVQHFDELFPGWKIYDEESPGLKIPRGARDKPAGVQYKAGRGQFIDILCIDPNEELVVIELKRDRAPDHVVTQTDRYLTWVEQNLAEPGQRVRGLIIAKSPEERLVLALKKRPNIGLWTYNLQLQFDRNAGEIPS